MKSLFQSMKNIVILLIAVMSISSLLSCGPYSFSGSALKGLDTISVPLFENETTQYGIREDLTDQLTEALVQDNTLKVVNVRRADSVIRGVVKKYVNECYTYDASGSCDEYISRVYVDVTFEDMKHKEVLWEEKNIEGYGIYSANGETEDDGMERAIEKLSANIIDKIIKGW
ncbi:MAG: LptE family protein [candidate division Zixibacteria bacterium]|nr:LptE family protein [candidate division Zixibacteria bacterium]